jgi:hypothetical protein
MRLQGAWNACEPITKNSRSRYAPRRLEGGFQFVLFHRRRADPPDVGKSPGTDSIGGVAAPWEYR